MTFFRYVKPYLICFMAACSIGSAQQNDINCEFADCAMPCQRQYKAHQFYVGPEVSHVHRKKEGGTFQNGVTYGGRFGYDYIKRYKFYIGAEGNYSIGRLTGKKTHRRLHSNYTDANIEGRVGYTFAQKGGYRLFFTPFVGGGIGLEKNNFTQSSPIPVHFRIWYQYVVAGFLSQASFSPCWDAGINFKARFLIDARNKVSNDPDFDSVTMLVKNRMHYRVELPLTYWWNQCLSLRLVPYYEYRQYGKQANFPFDFLETKLNVYGAVLKFMYSL